MGGCRVVSSLRWFISALPALPEAGESRSDDSHCGPEGAHGVGPALAAGLGLTGWQLAVVLRIHLYIAAAQ
jgi:hypothetical protein